MHRRRGALFAGGIAIAALTLTATPAAAGPSAAETADQAAERAAAQATEKLPAGMLKAMQRDLGLTEAQARTRITNEFKAGKEEAGLRAELGASWAGSWVTGKTSDEIVVATTDAAEAEAIEAAGATAEVVDDSLAELNAVKRALDRASAERATTDAPVWYVDVTSNTVVLHAKKTAAAKEFVSAAGLDAGDVKIVRSGESPRPYYDLRGGEAYYINNSGRCSIGFPVTRGSTQGYATAGHCGRAGASTSGHNRVAQGTFQASSFPGNDMAWVAVNSNWTVTPYVRGSGGANVTVSGSTQAAVGASICRSGSTTGWHCGTIQQHNTSVTYPEGTITGVTRTSVCAEPGDSGGSYISGSQAQGVTSGGSGNCSIGGTTYHQPINEILSAYGLTLVTSGGGDPDPPTGCSGYESTHSGSLSSGGQAVQPNGSYYYSSSSGTHRGCLDGPSGSDFDLYLQKWSGSSWTTVARGITSAADETVGYSGTSGYYRWIVHAYSGSGSYTLGLDRP
ncbi:S1 family peptidase [Streptomyces aidingensis]|uniref:Streptogrisin C n=1 Tax=Streptomyces aidingensis TaxID=910347 RepID=A0A1I1J151_9ACTN|nr:S1 family peptidase [Streptomyces aidingensis]SFC42319.1 streptogrisin C [Streptomyces aidingensis]